MHLRAAIVSLVFALVVAFAPARARAGIDDPVVPKELQHVGVQEHLDGQLPLDLIFKDQTGKPVRLGQLFDGNRPVLLTFAYHSCPVLCSMVLNGVAQALSEIKWTIGKEFDVITISIDPNDSYERTAAKRDALLATYKRPEAQTGWHFLLGDETSIKRATEAMGFEYTYDAESKQYGHPAVVMLLKPNGRVSRYLYGIEQSPNDVKLGLLEASEGKSISTVDKVILYCYKYDPHDGKYTVVAQRVMKLGGAVTAVFLAAFLSILWLRERARGKADARAALPAEPDHASPKPKESA